MDSAALHRFDERAGKTAGRQRTSHLRAFGRCGFVRRSRINRSRSARRQGKAAPDLRLREQWPAAQERIRKSTESPARQAQAACGCHRRERSLSSQTEGRERSRKKAQDHRERIHKVSEREARRIEK